MKLIRLGSVVALAGYILSGPAGFLFVKLMKPQPAWVSAAEFVNNYSILQDIPFILGFLLIGGMVLLSAGHYLEMKDKFTIQGVLALVITIIFATLISFNYICQTTFVRNLAIHYKPEYDATITTFSMSNPLSLAWSVEMWSYAFLGIATWLWAGYYKAAHRFTSILLAVNGILSVMTAILSLISLDWVMTPAGLTGYMAWNGLMILLMILIYRHATTNPEHKT